MASRWHFIPGPFIEQSILSPLKCTISVINQVAICLWMYFWGFYFSNTAPIPHCLNYRFIRSLLDLLFFWNWFFFGKLVNMDKCLNCIYYYYFLPMESMLCHSFYHHTALFCSRAINCTPVLEAILKMYTAGHKEGWETVVVRKKNALSQGEKRPQHVVWWWSRVVVVVFF